jgi:hypothetical protein
VSEQEEREYGGPMMAWFGESWGAPVNADCPRVRPPVGRPCLFCADPIASGDAGVVVAAVRADHTAAREPLHLECHMRSSIGSVGHLQRRCSCYGGHEGDPRGMSKREAARAAYWLFLKQQNGGGES